MTLLSLSRSVHLSKSIDGASVSLPAFEFLTGCLNNTPLPPYFFLLFNHYTFLFFPFIPLRPTLLCFHFLSRRFYTPHLAIMDDFEYSSASARLHKCILLSEPRASADPFQVCIGVTSDDNSGQTAYARCHRDSLVSILYHDLRATGKFEGRVFHYEGQAIVQDSEMTFRDLITQETDTALFVAVLPASLVDEGSVELIAPKIEMKEILPSEQKTPVNFNFGAILQNASLDELEEMVQNIVGALESLKKQLLNQEADAMDVKDFMSRIDTVVQSATSTPVVIGVVGNTGSGKSSMINALLGFERLVPTSCFRACTATINLIHYNHENEMLRAVIEFIDPADWRHELEQLYQDETDSTSDTQKGRSTATSVTEKSKLTESESLAKLKVVYPYLTKQDIQKYNVQKLMTDTDVVVVLGTKLVIEESDPSKFYTRLQELVNSGEKGDNGRKTSRRTSE
jgi:hypothetical protein